MEEAKIAGRPRLALIVTDAYAFNVLSRDQLEYFKDLGIEMDLYCQGTAAQLTRLRERDVGRVIHIPFRREPSVAWDLLALMSLISRLIVRRYDAVVFSTPKAMFLGSLASALTGQRRRLSFVRGRAYETKTGFVRKIFLGMDRISFALSTQVIFISNSLRQAFGEDGVRLGAKALVLGHGSSNGVDLARFRELDIAQKTSLRADMHVPEAGFVIVVPGRIVPDKGIGEALDLIDRLGDRSDIHWYFIGWPETDDLMARIRRRADQRVVHLDHTDRLQDWLGLADLAFLPSHREGFGNVVIEAAACGLPVLAFDVVGIQDNVQPGVTGKLVPFGDLDACESFIRQAADDRPGFRAAYVGARSWVAERFENLTVWRNYARAYLGQAFADDLRSTDQTLVGDGIGPDGPDDGQRNDTQVKGKASF
ncbi:glycosyltransferase [Pseudopontixanthobacter vadosimaris]|uniref:glycosyltransferase n=1 Tax=Pseudopontixanthobacter vadosimaris TaxID=2726450 RepID=UPI00147674B4|nr:glycosyltransferase [Pseudopontixanthobacter vadosimaris]